MNYTLAAQAVRMLVDLPNHSAGEEDLAYGDQMRLLEEWETRIAGVHVSHGIAPEVARHAASAFLCGCVAAIRMEQRDGSA